MRPGLFRSFPRQVLRSDRRAATQLARCGCGIRSRAHPQLAVMSNTIIGAYQHYFLQIQKKSLHLLIFLKELRQRAKFVKGWLLLLVSMILKAIGTRTRIGRSRWTLFLVAGLALFPRRDRAFLLASVVSGLLMNAAPAQATTLTVT